MDWYTRARRALDNTLVDLRHPPEVLHLVGNCDCTRRVEFHGFVAKLQVPYSFEANRAGTVVGSFCRCCFGNNRWASLDLVHFHCYICALVYLLIRVQ